MHETRHNRSTSLCVRQCYLACLLLLRSSIAQKPEYGNKSNAEKLDWMPCWAEQGTGSPRHEQVLDLLNGRKLAFVGDSLTRYATR